MKPAPIATGLAARARRRWSLPLLLCLAPTWACAQWLASSPAEQARTR